MFHRLLGSTCTGGSLDRDLHFGPLRFGINIGLRGGECTRAPMVNAYDLYWDGKRHPFGLCSLMAKAENPINSPLL